MGNFFKHTESQDFDHIQDGDLTSSQPDWPLKPQQAAAVQVIWAALTPAAFPLHLQLGFFRGPCSNSKAHFPVGRRGSCWVLPQYTSSDVLSNEPAARLLICTSLDIQESKEAGALVIWFSALHFHFQGQPFKKPYKTRWFWLCIILKSGSCSKNIAEPQQMHFLFTNTVGYYLK